jgi:hypothetical protein
MLLPLIGLVDGFRTWDGCPASCTGPTLGTAPFKPGVNLEVRRASNDGEDPNGRDEGTLSGLSGPLDVIPKSGDPLTTSDIDTDAGNVDVGIDPDADVGNVDVGIDDDADAGNVDAGIDDDADAGNVVVGIDPDADPGNVDVGIDPDGGDVDGGGVDAGTDALASASTVL